MSEAMTKTRPRKKYFTVEEANKMLPLARVILRDITNLAIRLRDCEERLMRLRGEEAQWLDPSRREELEAMEEQFERDREKMQEYEQELVSLGIELKDYYTGLVDFPCMMDGREVYLCWRMDEPEVGHWHEIEAGFAGRQKLLENPSHA